MDIIFQPKTEINDTMHIVSNFEWDFGQLLFKIEGISWFFIIFWKNFQATNRNISSTFLPEIKGENESVYFWLCWYISGPIKNKSAYNRYFYIIFSGAMKTFFQSCFQDNWYLDFFQIDILYVFTLNFCDFFQTLMYHNLISDKFSVNNGKSIFMFVFQKQVMNSFKHACIDL